MIRSVDITNLTVFPRAKITFRGLNVIVGENGTGKSHLLKILYCVLATLASDRRSPAAPTKSMLQTALADKLVNVFRPESLGRLARRRQGRERCDIKVNLSRGDVLDFSFATNSKTEVQVATLPSRWIDESAAYLPTRELLTIFPNFISIYEGHYLEFEETWRDTCVLLGAPLARGPREARVRELLEPLEAAMGGSIQLEKTGRFYLVTDSGRMEMPLVAEGLRKLGMVARLIASGRLVGSGYLFWDEPEANLNPRLVKSIARTIVDLSASGIQVFIASHSLFLLRELEIITRDTHYSNLKVRYVGLDVGRDGVVISQGDSINDVASIAALDEELDQADRFMETDG